MSASLSDLSESVKFALKSNSIFENLFVFYLYLLVFGIATLFGAWVYQQNVFIGGLNLIILGTLGLLSFILLILMTNVAIVREAYNNKTSFMNEFKKSTDVFWQIFVYSIIILIIQTFICKVLDYGIPTKTFSSICTTFLSIAMMLAPVYIIVKKWDVFEAIKSSFDLFIKNMWEFASFFALQLIWIFSLIITGFLTIVLYVFSTVALISGTINKTAIINFIYYLNEKNYSIAVVNSIVFLFILSALLVICNRAITNIAVIAFKKIAEKTKKIKS